MITYAGVELCYEDPDGVITAWIEKFLPLEDLADQSWPPAALVSQRSSARSRYEPGVNLTLPNYPEPPRRKLSTLYWPTGACRWARCYLLAAGNDVVQVLGKLSGNSPQSLVLSDQDNGSSITASMYLLPPRKLTAALGGDDSLYLLPLVDGRYYWQFRNSGDLHVTTSSAWADVFAQLSSQLGATIAYDAINGAYGIPDPDELHRPIENLAMLLDAVARSVGQVIVVELDGTVRSLGWSTSAARAAANLAAGSAIAGGEFSSLNRAAVVPAEVVVSFQKWREGAVDPNGELHTVSTPAPVESTSGTTKIIHSTAFADFTDESLNNGAEVNALAAQIAADYYDSLSWRYDVALESIFAWQPSGFDDCVEWILGRRCGDEYQVYTRAQGRPYNFGEEEQLQQFADKPVYPSPTRFTLKADLIPDPGNVTSALAVHRKWDTGSNQYVDTTDQLRAFDSLKAHPGLNGQSGLAVYKGDSLRWEISEFDDRFLTATLLADLAPGGTAQAQITGSGAVPVTDWMQTGGRAGDKVYIRWAPQDQLWYTWSGRNVDESTIISWPPPVPPWEPGDPDPPYWTAEISLCQATSEIGVYGAGTAQILRASPLTLVAGVSARNNTPLLSGVDLSVQTFAQPVMHNEFLYVWCANPTALDANKRYFVLRSEFSGGFYSKYTGGGTWSMGTGQALNVYRGQPVNQQSNSTIDANLQASYVYNGLGDVPTDSWVRVASDATGWYLESAQCDLQV